MSGVATLTLGPQAICNDEHALVEEGYRVADLRGDQINVDSDQFNHLEIPLLLSLATLTGSFQREGLKMIHNNRNIVTLSPFSALDKNSLNWSRLGNLRLVLASKCSQKVRMLSFS